jgi:hypothetical protein
MDMSAASNGTEAHSMGESGGESAASTLDNDAAAAKKKKKSKGTLRISHYVCQPVVAPELDAA